MEVEERPQPTQAGAGPAPQSRRSSERPIFSAYEVGKIAVPVERIIAEELGGHTPVLTEDTPTLEVFELYRNYPRADFFPVKSRDGKIAGYLRRQMFFAALSQNDFTRDLLLKPNVSIGSLMDPRVAIIDAWTRLSDASDRLMAREEEIRFDPFVITLDGEVMGISSVRRLLEGLNKYLRMDMEACARAQRSLLDSPPLQKVENLAQTYVSVLPLADPGGDIAGVVELSERLTLLYLFDVCGKGLPASQMTLVIGAAIRSLFSEPVSQDADLLRLGLSQRLQRFNRLVSEITPETNYATGIVAAYDKQTRVLQLFDYGHALAYLRRGSRVFSLCEGLEGDQSGEPPFFGISAETRAPVRNFQLRRGDLFMLCSDGIAEQKNEDGVDWGPRGICAALRCVDPEQPLDAALVWMEASWRAYRGQSRITDDRSWLFLRAD